MNEYEAIVRELAALSPQDGGAEEYAGALACLYCKFPGYGEIEETDNHEPSCLWRRARMLQSALAGTS